MAIQSEIQGNLILQWSDDNRYLVKQDGSGLKVEKALDPISMPHEYIEGEIIETVIFEIPEPEPAEIEPLPYVPTLDERMDEVEAAIIELASIIGGD